MFFFFLAIDPALYFYITFVIFLLPFQSNGISACKYVSYLSYPEERWHYILKKIKYLHHFTLTLLKYSIDKI